MPLGELESPPVRTELPAWLAWYKELDRHGGEDLLVMLMEGDEIAAFCETAFDARFPNRVHQILTAVARPWRGRGLAKGVKAAMMELIRHRHPDIRFVSTSNASHNAPMLAINAKLGFEEHRRNRHLIRSGWRGWRNVFGQSAVGSRAGRVPPLPVRERGQG